jgi:hypothetical protein
MVPVANLLKEERSWMLERKVDGLVFSFRSSAREGTDRLSRFFGVLGTVELFRCINRVAFGTTGDKAVTLLPRPAVPP